VLAHGVVGGLGGGVSGAVGAVTSQTVVPLLAAEINKLDIPKELKEGLILAAGAAVGAATGGVPHRSQTAAKRHGGLQSQA
jgi:filamentous hemagglutinin